jgi:putative membrane protein
MLANEEGQRGIKMTDWTSGHGWMMGMGWMFMVIFWVLIVLAIVALIRWLGISVGNRRETQQKTPIQILQERYARGEIERKEYEQKRRNLEK